MKNHVLFLLLLVGIVSCKKDPEPVVPPDGTANALATVLSIQTISAEVFSDAFSTGQDTLAALNSVGQWLLDQPEVKDVYYWDLQTVQVRFVNGLNSFLSMVYTDPDGQHLTRGGGGGSGLHSFGRSSAKLIGNKKVLVLNPYVDEFYNDNYTKEPVIESSPFGLEATVLNGAEVTYSVFNSFSDYGFILLNTHGLPHAFNFRQFADIPLGDKSAWTAEQVLERLAADGVPMERFANGELELNVDMIISGESAWKKQVYYTVTDKFIRNGPFNLNDAVVFGNYCYSGYTAAGPDSSNMPEAFKSKGAITYYGYASDDGNSQKVWNPSARDMEDSIIANLMYDGDSTGIAHLAGNTTRQRIASAGYVDVPVKAVRGLSFTPLASPPVVRDMYFTQFYEPDYSYTSCEDSVMTDPRDLQEYDIVCIGDQTWMAENLNYNAPGSVCYDSLSANCASKGRLYGRDQIGFDTCSTNPGTMQSVCPPNWHLPSRAEYQELVDYCGGLEAANIKLNSPSAWPSPNAFTDEFGLNLIPTGYYDFEFGGGGFSGYDDVLTLWTSTGNPGLYKYGLFKFDTDYDFVFSTFNLGPDVVIMGTVRCLKD